MHADRSEDRIHLIEQYLKATKQLRDYLDESQDPNYTKVNTQNGLNSWFEYGFYECLYLRFLAGDHAGPVDDRHVRVGPEASARSRLCVGNAHRLPPVSDQQGEVYFVICLMNVFNFVVKQCNVRQT